ncbi:thioredoxin family protein [Myroides sp. DW712]|uniref:thioredoxin family protein n=1 Tax=Myroides sp. DW712 TaxID=3389800 RepID=UPI00397B39C5
MLKNVGLAILCSIAFVACKKDAKKIEAIDPIEEVIEPVNDFKEVSGYKIGDQATDFSLIGIDDKKHSLADFPEAKGYIVIFTCNHCPYAKAYEERIVALDQKYKTLGYPVVAINPNDPVVQPEDGLELMKERAKEKGFTFPYLLDEGQKIYPQYGATKTPHVFLLQKAEGKNIVKYIGAIDDNYEDASQVSVKYVENAVDALLAGKAIEQTTTVAIGCSIKVK